MYKHANVMPSATSQTKTNSLSSVKESTMHQVLGLSDKRIDLVYSCTSDTRIKIYLGTVEITLIICSLFPLFQVQWRY